MSAGVFESGALDFFFDCFERADNGLLLSRRAPTHNGDWFIGSFPALQQPFHDERQRFDAHQKYERISHGKRVWRRVIARGVGPSQRRNWKRIRGA